MKPHSLVFRLLLCLMLVPLWAYYDAVGQSTPIPADDYTQGLELTQLGEYADAIAAFTRALDVEPNNVEVLIARGIAYRLSGERTMALRDFAAAEELATDDPRIYYEQGNVYRDRGN